jgi:hypothetical protein
MESGHVHPQTATVSDSSAASSRKRFSLRLPALIAVIAAMGSTALGVGHATGAVRSQLLPRAAGPTESAEIANVVAAARAVAGSKAFTPNYAATAANLRRWDKRFVTVHITPSKDDNKTEGQVRKLFVKALNLWNGKIGDAIQLTLTDDADADITVSFVQPGSLAGGAIGRTDVTFRLNDQVLTHANVRLNLGLSPDEFLQVSAHEMGHALGIQGHSTDPRDLMYTYAHTPAEVTERDLNTMSLSYAPALRSRSVIASVPRNASGEARLASESQPAR